MGPKIDVTKRKWKNSNFCVHLNEALVEFELYRHGSAPGRIQRQRRPRALLTTTLPRITQFIFTTIQVKSLAVLLYSCSHLCSRGMWLHVLPSCLSTLVLHYTIPSRAMRLYVSATTTFISSDLAASSLTNPNYAIVCTCSQTYSDTVLHKGRVNK
jgi:hypothetical protein